MASTQLCETRLWVLVLARSQRRSLLLAGDRCARQRVQGFFELNDTPIQFTREDAWCKNMVEV